MLLAAVNIVFDAGLAVIIAVPEAWVTVPICDNYDHETQDLVPIALGRIYSPCLLA